MAAAFALVVTGCVDESQDPETGSPAAAPEDGTAPRSEGAAEESTGAPAAADPGDGDGSDTTVEPESGSTESAGEGATGTADGSAGGDNAGDGQGDAAGAEGDPGEDAGAGESETQVPSQPLTASDTGVTETSITLGIPAVDVEQLQALGLLAGIELDEMGAWESAMANVNDRGGVAGRTLEAVYSVYLPLGVAQADAACVELVQDNEIFAAIGTLIVPESALCYTELNGTPFVGVGTITEEIAGRSIEAVLTTDASVERLRIGMIDLAESEGALQRPVAVHGDERGAIESAVRELQSRGANVVSISTVSAPETDVQARVAEYEGIFERWRSDGAEVVINVGTTLDILSAMGRQEFYIDVYTAESGAFNYQPDEEREYEALRHVTSVTGAPSPGEEHAPTVACHDAFNTRYPDMNLTDHPDQSWIVGVSCAVVEIFAAAAAAAGPELTHESFAAAAGGVGVIDLPGFGEVRVGGDSPGPTRAAVSRYDDEMGFYAEVGSVPLR